MTNNNKFLLIEFSLFILGLLSGKKMIPYSLITLSIVCIAFYGIFINRSKINFLSLSLMLEPAYRRMSKYVFGSTKVYMYYEYLLIFFFLFGLLKKRQKTFINYSIILIPWLFIELNSYIFSENSYSRSIILHSILFYLSVLYAHNFYKINKAELIDILKGFCLGGAYLGGLAFSSHFFGNIEFKVGSSHAASGRLPPIHLSSLLGISVMSKIILLGHIDKNKIAHYFSIIIYSGILILTFSRTGVILLLISTSAYYIFRFRNYFYYLPFILILPFIISYFFEMLNDYTGGFLALRYADDLASDRLYIWQSIFEIFKNNINGIGLGNAHSAIAQEGYLDSNTGVHNPFLRVLVEDGVFGFFFYIMFHLIFGLKLTFSNARNISIPFFLIYMIITMSLGMKLAMQFYIIMVIIGVMNNNNKTNNVFNI